MTTYREVVRPRIAKLIADARAAGGDEKAVRKAVRWSGGKYGASWHRQVWYDECAKQLGKTKGRIPPRRGTRAAIKKTIENSGAQGRLFT